ncbi:MAG: hypothetical protein FJ207_05270 [Gemmatimonadetes bacterium]|nr:hypothetical protein [Gemmatimonadota bacterium]
MQGSQSVCGARNSVSARNAPRLLAVIALGVAMAGCQTLFPRRDPFSEPAAQSVQLDVRNRNFYDATIYVINESGQSRRIGDVVGNGSRSFQFPWDVTSALRIRIDLLAGQSCITAPIVVNPGDELGLDIVPDFRQSAYCQ